MTYQRAIPSRPPFPPAVMVAEGICPVCPSHHMLAVMSLPEDDGNWGACPDKKMAFRIIRGMYYVRSYEADSTVTVEVPVSLSISEYAPELSFVRLDPPASLMLCAPSARFSAGTGSLSRS